MNIEILILGVFIGLTLIAYMIAINAHGPIRLGLSYLIATAMLAGSVWAIVQHVNTQINLMNSEEIQRLQSEKQSAEQKASTQEQALVENKGRIVYATRLNGFITKGISIATIIANVNVQENTTDLEGLMKRANDMTHRVAEFRKECDALQQGDTLFSQALPLLTIATQLLTEAAYYYRTYYRSEDSEQEQVRERLMRQRARDTIDKLQIATTLIASTT